MRHAAVFPQSREAPAIWARHPANATVPKETHAVRRSLQVAIEIPKVPAKQISNF